MWRVIHAECAYLSGTADQTPLAPQEIKERVQTLEIEVEQLRREIDLDMDQQGQVGMAMHCRRTLPPTPSL